MLERLNLLLQAASVALLFAAFAFGTATIAVGYLLGKRQEARVADAKAEAAAANERSLKLELSLSQQQERAAKAETELLEVRKALAPRSLSTAERARLIAELSEGPRCDIWIISNTGEGEATRFAAILEAAFIDAGWACNRVLSSNDQIRPGIGIAQKRSGEKTPCFLNVENAFRTIAFNPWATTYSDLLDSEGTFLQLLVGPKP